MSFFFFFNDTATTEIYTLSLHDALPICSDCFVAVGRAPDLPDAATTESKATYLTQLDRKSTRLNSSHQIISYAVFCLKKKRMGRYPITTDNRRHCIRQRRRV